MSLLVDLLDPVYLDDLLRRDDPSGPPVEGQRARRLDARGDDVMPAGVRRDAHLPEVEAHVSPPAEVGRVPDLRPLHPDVPGVWDRRLLDPLGDDGSDDVRG